MKLHTTCNMMPNQIEVELDDGRELYFRARWHHWALYQYTDDNDIDWDNPLAQGDEPDAGWWTVEQAEQKCRAAIAAWDSGTPGNPT